MVDKKTWANREDLDKKTIEAILEQTPSIECLGEYSVDRQSVPYSFDELDLTFSLRYILDHDLIGEFKKLHADACKRDCTSRLRMEYFLPIPNRGGLGRSTPNVLFEISANIGNDSAFGTLSHFNQSAQGYEGSKHEIVRFYNIPISSKN